MLYLRGMLCTLCVGTHAMCGTCTMLGGHGTNKGHTIHTMRGENITNKGHSTHAILGGHATNKGHEKSEDGGQYSLC